MVLKAVCILEGSVSGTVYFNQRDEKSPVIVSGEVSGLKKGKHGIHIHEFGDKTKGCDSIGFHWNPEKCAHGGPASEERHLGDLGNIEAQKDGAVTRVCIRDSKISLVGANSIIGRALVIHEREDDLGEGGTEYSKTTGGTGPCLSCGIIGIRKP